jgi:hypothetical protein
VAALIQWHHSIGVLLQGNCTFGAKIAKAATAAISSLPMTAFAP